VKHILLAALLLDVWADITGYSVTITPTSETSRTTAFATSLSVTQREHYRRPASMGIRMLRTNSYATVKTTQVQVQGLSRQFFSQNGARRDM
jgi:hypothetical protein